MKHWLGAVIVSILWAASEVSGDPAVFCYYSSYAQNREGLGKFTPEDIDPHLCTHVIFAFADIIKGKYLKASSWNDLPNGKDEGLYARTIALKKENPRLKVLLAVGGWRIGSDPFIPVVETPESREAFIRNVIRYLRKHNFDGLDMDWEFPGTRGSSADDKYKFTALLKELREGFERESRQTNRDRLLLTMAAAGGSYFIGLAYEPDKIIDYVDYLLLMAYNYHGSWNEYTGHHSGLYPRSDESGGEREWNQAWTIDYWLNDARAPREKIIVGIATYGMSFTLADPSEHGLKAAAAGGGKGGPHTKEKGILAYYEICEKLESGWNTVWLEEQRVPYAYLGDQWVGYDNTDSVAYKARNIKEKGLGGAFIWSVEMDDFSGNCGAGKYPLLSTIVDILSARDVQRAPARYSPPRGNTRDNYRAGSEDGQRYIEEHRGYEDEGYYDSSDDQRYGQVDPLPTKQVTRTRKPKNEYRFDLDVPQRAPEYYRKRYFEEKDDQEEDDIYGEDDSTYGEDRGGTYRGTQERARSKLAVEYRSVEDRRDQYDRTSRRRVPSTKRRTVSTKRNVIPTYDDSYRAPPSNDVALYDNTQQASEYTPSKSRERYLPTDSSRDSSYDRRDRLAARNFRTIYDSEKEARYDSKSVNYDSNPVKYDSKPTNYGSEPAKYDDSQSDSYDSKPTRRVSSNKLVVQEDTLNNELFNEVYGLGTKIQQQQHLEKERQQQQQRRYRPDPRAMPSGRVDDGYQPPAAPSSYPSGLTSQADDVKDLSSGASSSGTKCREAGMYPHPTSCRSYFICVRHGTRWYKFHLTCPPGLAYDPLSATCADVPSCRQ